MDKKTKFGITLAVTAILVIGGVMFAALGCNPNASDKVCEYCGQTVVNLGMHQISCEENPNDATMNTKGTGKVRNND